MSYKIEVLCENDLNANTYLIYNETSCIIIDPANNIKTLKRFIDKRSVLGVFLTHGHYDHFKKLKALLEEYNVKVYMHKLAYPKLLDPSISYATMFSCFTPMVIDENKIVFVNDGSKINLGDFLVRCWYTPGHTDCMMTYIIDDNMFTGDFLFNGSIGRTDLLTSNKRQMYNAIKEIKARKLNYHIYPGHEKDTTLDNEKKNNIYLSDDNLMLVFEDFDQ